MRKIIYFIIACFILTFGYSISFWTNRPLQPRSPHDKNLKNCDACHQSSLSQDAWKGVPEWHSEQFSNPLLNSDNREEHRRIAHNHRNECMQCHAPSFQIKCAGCHVQNEWK